MSSLDFLHGIDVVEIDDGLRPIQTAASSIIAVVGTAGMGPVNIPGLVSGDRRDGVLQYGTYSDDGFSIPEALSGIFDQIGATVVVLNVCDPAVHVTEVMNEVITFGLNTFVNTLHPYISAASVATAWAALGTVSQAPSAGARTITLPVGTTIVGVKSLDGVTSYVTTTDYTVASNVITIVPGGALGTIAVDGAQLLISYTATVVNNVDYTVNLQTGQFQRIIGGKIMPQASGKVSYTYVDPSLITDEEIIGGVDASGNYTGLYALYSSETLWEVIPRILIAPRYMHQKANAVTANPVVSELLGVANRLKSVIFADGPNTTDQAAVQYREDWGSDRIMVVDPFVNVPGPYGTGFQADGITPWLMPSSISWAGATAMMDNSVGFWASMSNQELAGVVGVGRAIDFSLSDPSSRSNYLNSNQVSVIIRKDGFRTWGNRSTSVDPAWQFLCVRRTADMIEESIADSLLWAVDRIINTAFFTSVIGSVNSYLRYLTALGAIYGGHAWADRSLNTNEVIANGQAYIDFDFTAPFPAEHITLRAHLVDDYVQEIFDGLASDLQSSSPTVGSTVTQAAS